MEPSNLPVPLHERTLAVPTKRKRFYAPSHLDVRLSPCPQEELDKDVWDMRQLKENYPKHMSPSSYIVDFTWIVNPVLRRQVKHYLRLQLPHWEPITFQCVCRALKPFLSQLPPEVHLATLTREHVTKTLPSIYRQGNRRQATCLYESKAFLDYAATSPSWTELRPERFLLWSEDIPAPKQALPRPIPPDVVDQLDRLLDVAGQAISSGLQTAIHPPMIWDAILILRRTGMRYEDLAHLKAPDRHGRGGCLQQDSDGYWWVCIDHKITKMGRDHHIPTRMSDGVVEAIYRQRERIQDLPNHFEENYLFRTPQGVLSYSRFRLALCKLAPHLTHEGNPYTITPHQFRHTIATDMIEMGVDIYTVKEFLGHKSIAMTERYVKVYLTSLKAKYDAYRAKKLQTSAAEMLVDQVQVSSQGTDVDGGWVPEKVGKLYLSPLPDGVGNCAHLPMHDPCPDVPHCPTCPKLRASTRHLPMWENKVKNLQLTVEALRANPAYTRARQKHEQELAHAEKVIKTIKEEGFWDGRIHNRKTNTN